MCVCVCVRIKLECLLVPTMIGVLPYCVRSESACWHWHSLCMTCQTEAQNSNMPAAHCELFHLRFIPIHSFVPSRAFSPSLSLSLALPLTLAVTFALSIMLGILSLASIYTHRNLPSHTERIAQFLFKCQPPVVDSLSLACIAKRNPFHQFCSRTKIHYSLKRQGVTEI